ncbi:hypothetical protein [Comamonas sp.]|uniref:hypothetical protein n=1 Tax=Comamonas sp. TaxID=34028 RepID=UPI003A8DBE4C
MQDKLTSKAAIPAGINIAPRGQSWLNGQLVDGAHGYPTRQSMESAERAANGETSQHPDDAAVDALAAIMKAKLFKQRAKGYSGWNTEECTQQRLSDMLRGHVDKGDPVNVANFCAFLSARGEGIAPQAAPAAVAVPDEFMSDLGFALEQRGAVWVVVDDAGGIGSASLNERILWKALIEARAALAATPAAAPADREDFAWLVVQEACETEPADEDDPECIRILRRDLKTAVLAAFIRGDIAAAAPVVLPEPVVVEKGTQAVMQLVADYTRKAVLESSGNYPEITLAQMNEAWSAIFGKVRALLATATGLPAQAVLDHPWRDRLLDGRTLVRDESGFAEHPELPMLDEGMKPRAFFAALGVEMKHTMAEDDLTMDEYDALNDAENWSPWAPRPPSGEAWNLVAIFDTEDGPAAWWARAQKESREAAPQAQADARDAEITWPKARDVGRFDDMSPGDSIRVGLDSDNDVYVSVCGGGGVGSVEFCNPGGSGGGQSSRTRLALIALMVAMEADNAEKPSRDWWSQHAAIAAAKGEQQ